MFSNIPLTIQFSSPLPPYDKYLTSISFVIEIFESNPIPPVD